MVTSTETNRRKPSMSPTLFNSAGEASGEHYGACWWKP